MAVRIPESSATGMKSMRLQYAALRVAPAHEALDADDLLRRGGDQRLVLQEELVALEGAVQLGVERQPVRLLLVQPGVEELPAVAAGVRGLPHGGVGVAQELARGRAVGGVDRHAEAHGQEELVVVHHQRLAHRREQAGDGGGGLHRARRARQQRGEGAGAEVRHGVLGAPGLLEPPSELLQQQVDVRVPERRLDRVEAVDAEGGEREGQALALRVLERLSDALLEERAVGEAGHRVVEQQVADLLLALALLRPVDQDRRAPDDLAVGVVARRRLRGDPEAPAEGGGVRAFVDTPRSPAPPVRARRGMLLSTRMSGMRRPA